MSGLKVLIYKHRFLTAVLFAIFLAEIYPALSATEDPLKFENSIKYIGVASLMVFIYGLTISPNAFLNAINRHKVHLNNNLFTFGFSLITFFIFVVLIIYALNNMVNINKWILEGLLTVSCLPSPISSAIVSIKGAGGSEAIPIFKSVVGSCFGLLLTPGSWYIMGLFSIMNVTGTSAANAVQKSSSIQESIHNSISNNFDILRNSYLEELNKMLDELVKNVQIRESVQQGITSALENSIRQKDISKADVHIQYFNINQNNMPQLPNFTFTIYAPWLFKKIRDNFEINNIIESFKGKLQKLSNTEGASGSEFYLTEDKRFVVKTAQIKEKQFLIKILFNYYKEIYTRKKGTLITKFIGLYCYKNEQTTMMMVVINNVFPASIEIHETYDLKGTLLETYLYGEHQKEKHTYNDIDFIIKHPLGLFLEQKAFKTLINNIENDCKFLSKHQIMGYSLLLGIHYLDKEKYNKEEMSTEKLKEKYPDGILAENAEGKRLILFVGIIDILQYYIMDKKTDYFFREFFFKEDSTISKELSNYYTKRFQTFMKKNVFKETNVLTSKVNKLLLKYMGT